MKKLILDGVEYREIQKEELKGLTNNEFILVNDEKSQNIYFVKNDKKI